MSLTPKAILQLKISYLNFEVKMEGDWLIGKMISYVRFTQRFAGLVSSLTVLLDYIVQQGKHRVHPCVGI